MKRAELRKEIIKHIRCYQKNLTEEYLDAQSDNVLINNVHPFYREYYGKKLTP